VNFNTGMWIFDLLDLITGRWTVPVLLTLTIALAVGCLVAPRKNEAARRSSAAAGINPLWLLVPFGGLFFTSPLGADRLGLRFLSFMAQIPGPMWLLAQVGFFVGQAGLSVLVARRHRAWPWLVWPLTIVLGVLTAATAVTDVAVIAVSGSVRSHIKPIGGGWSIDEQLVSGSEPGYIKHVLLRGKTVVDDWVDDYRFFPPDCVIYQIKGPDLSWRAVCADRRPIQLPTWILQVKEDGPWGGYVATPNDDGTMTERWSRVPLDRVIATAQQQSAFFSILGWRPQPPAPPFERVYVDIVTGPPPPAIRFVPLRETKVDLWGARVLCYGTPMVEGSIRTNDNRRVVSELFGRIVAVDVHEYGMYFSNFAAVDNYLHAQLAKRPQKLYRYNPWQEDGYRPYTGVTATIRFASGLEGRLETVNDSVADHLCMGEPDGDSWWWISVEPRDLWP